MFSAKSVVWSGFRAGGLRSFLLRPSVHARSGRVVVLSFARQAAAAACARRWAGRLGVAVRVSFIGGLWAVSVPVPASSSRLPAGAAFPWAVSGVQSVVAALAASGVRSV